MKNAWNQVSAKIEEQTAAQVTKLTEIMDEADQVRADCRDDVVRNAQVAPNDHMTALAFLPPCAWRSTAGRCTEITFFE